MDIKRMIAKELGRRHDSIARELSPVAVDCDRSGISITIAHTGVRELAVSFDESLTLRAAVPSPGRAVIPWSFVQLDGRGEAAFRVEYLLDDERVTFRGAVRAGTSACMSVSELYFDQ